MVSSRQLLLLERIPPPTETGPRLIGSVTLARANGEREPIPVQPPEQLGGLAWVAWGLDGEVVVSHSTQHASSLWSEGDEEPWLLHASPHYIEEGSASMAPDDRYLVKHEWSAYDSPLATVELFDLLERKSLGGHGASEISSFHLLGGGPDFLVVRRDCEAFGSECLEHTLTHVRPGREREVLAVHPEQAPRVTSVAPGGDFVIVEHDDRWQLHQLHPERDHVVVIDEPLGVGPVTWSHDGSLLVYVDGLTLVVRDTTGATRWMDLGYVPGLWEWSPVDDRLAVVPLHGPAADRVVIVDPVRSEISMQPYGDPVSKVLWSPTGETLLVTSRCDSLPSRVAFDLIDPSTGERLRVTQCDVPFERERWAPDGSMFAFQETCDDEQTRVRIIDDRGVQLGHSPCGALSLGTWSPDSDVIAVMQDDRTHALYPDGHMVDLGPGNPGAWRPGPLRE